MSASALRTLAPPVADASAGLAPSRAEPASIESRLARDKARAEAFLDLARRMGGDASARFVMLIPEPVWGGDWRGLILDELGMSPYGDWNLALVTTSPEALEAGAMPDWPDMEPVACDRAAQGAARIAAALREGRCDAVGARAALEQLARDIRNRWERHATCGE